MFKALTLDVHWAADLKNTSKFDGRTLKKERNVIASASELEDC